MPDSPWGPGGSWKTLSGEDAIRGTYDNARSTLNAQGSDFGQYTPDTYTTSADYLKSLGFNSKADYFGSLGQSWDPAHPLYDAATDTVNQFNIPYDSGIGDYFGTVAKFAAMIGSAGAASGAIGAGAAAGGGGALAGGSGLVDGLGAAAAGYGGAAGGFAGSGLVDGLGAAASGYGGAGAAGADFFGGSGLVDGLGDAAGGYGGGGGLQYGDPGYNPGAATEGAGWNTQQYMDFPTTADAGGTSIYGSNPSLSDLYKQYQLSGQNPMNYLQQLTGMPNTPPGVTQLIKSFLGGDKSDNTLKTIGQLLSTGLGIYGANSQSNQINALSQQYAGYGAPYRSQLAAISADPNQFFNGPVAQQGLDAVLRKLSVGGNPAGSPYAQSLALQSLYGQYSNERSLLGNLGGLSNFNAAAPGLATQAIQSNGNVLNALGSGISAITNPPTTLEQFMNAINGNNFKIGNGTGLA